MKSSHLATTMLLSASMVAGIAFGVPSAGIAADQMVAESVEDAFEMSASGEVADQNDAVANTSANRAEADDQIDRYDVAYMDDCCYEQLTEQIPAIDATTTSLSGGWYALLDDVELNEALAVEGDAHLILVGDSTLSALEGIRVAEDSKLTLHTQDGATARVLVRKGVLRVLTDEQRAEEEQMIARELEADPEYRFREPQILFVEPCYEVVAGDNEPSTDPNHEFDPDHDPKLIEKPTFSTSLLCKDYLVIYPHASHRLSMRDGELVVRDGHLTCECCDGWFEDQDAHLVVAKTAEEKAAYEAAVRAQANEDGEGSTVVPEAESEEVVTIVFDANGGSGSMDPMMVAAGESFVLPECAFEPPSGMVFSQWSLGNPGATVSVPTSTTVRAWWKASVNPDEGSQPSQPEGATSNQSNQGNQDANSLSPGTDAVTTQQQSISQPTPQSATAVQDGSPNTSDPLVSANSVGFMLTMGVTALAIGREINKQ